MQHLYLTGIVCTITSLLATTLCAQHGTIENLPGIASALDSGFPDRDNASLPNAPLLPPWDVPPKPAQRLHFFRTVAGKYEAHTAIASELGKQLIRLDIGASTDVIDIELESVNHGSMQMPRITTSRITAGVDAFTWIRLQGADAFRSPASTFDYYVGINAVYENPRLVVAEYRLRAAHMASHNVHSGVPHSTDSAAYGLYSRQLVELTIRGAPQRGAGGNRRTSGACRNKIR